MGKIYYPTDNEETGEFCSALAIGDSWFWYPNQNILETLVRHPLVSDDHANIRLVGFNGAETMDYVANGKYADRIKHWLSPRFNHGFSEFYISGAGNDAVDYGLALKSNCAGITDPADCFDPVGLSVMLRRISEAIHSLLHNIRMAYADDGKLRPIFIHGYDYPVPDGRAFEMGPIHSGPWLSRAMDPREVRKDPHFRRQICRILIDRLNDEVLRPLSTPSNDVIYINSRGVLDSSENHYKENWTNELHPTTAGFRKIFDSCWKPRLLEAGILLKR